MDYVSGFALGLSLIFAIGSQNAFILKQGLKKQHVFAICLFCAVSDALLISAGVAGFGTVTAKYPNIVTLAKIAGALFLLGYGLQSLYASASKSHALIQDSSSVNSLKKSLMLCFGFTWLNPHVYLDTLILVGCASQRERIVEVEVWIGVVSVVFFVFFFGLGYGARLLSPYRQASKAWDILDTHWLAYS